MHGIAGIIQPDRVDPAVMEKLLGAVTRRDGSTASSFRCAELGVEGGRIHPEGRAASRPVWDEAGEIGVVLVGELYGDDPGSRFLVDGENGEFIREFLRDYRERGIGALERLNGWFSGVILDKVGRKAILFNDRYGLSRVYCHRAGKSFCFASEAKAILGARPETRSLDPQGLGEWLSCGCALQDRSLFAGIELLPPASAWVFGTDGSLEKHSYFDPSGWEGQEELSEEDYYAALAELFPTVLGRYFEGDDPIGMSLTGGLDGRMIMAWASTGRGELPCYTFNGPYRDCADARIAKRVADACGQPHQLIPVEDDLFGKFADLAEETVLLSDGAMDITGAVELYVNRTAREIAPVRLTGNYGSEILRCHVALRPGKEPKGVLDPAMADLAAGATDTYQDEFGTKPLSFIAFKQVPWHHYSRLPLERSLLTIRSPFLDNDLVKLVFQAPSRVAATLEPSLRLIAAGNPGLGRIPTDRGVTYPAAESANRIKKSANEFLAKAEYAYDYGMPQWLARLDHWFSALHFERLFLGHQKFFHFRIWYRKQLASYVREMICDDRTRNRSYLDGKLLDGLVDEHLRGTGNHTLTFHKLITLELLHRTLLDG